MAIDPQHASTKQVFWGSFVIALGCVEGQWPLTLASFVWCKDCAGGREEEGGENIDFSKEVLIFAK